MDKPKANPYAPFDLLLEELLERSCEHIIAEPGDELPLIRVSQAKRDLKQLVYALFDHNAELEAWVVGVLNIYRHLKPPDCMGPVTFEEVTGG